MKLMQKLGVALALVAFASLPSLAQTGYTTTTASLSSVCYNNGSVQASWINGNPSSPIQPTLNGASFAQSVPGAIDVNGNFNLRLADVAIVSPNSPNLSTWRITACAKGGSQPSCYTANVPATGSTFNATSYFSGATSACNPGGSGITQLTTDVTAGPGSGSQAATVVGLKNVPFCTGFTPTNGQAVTLTTASSPNPCWTAVVPTGGGSSGTVGQVQAAGSTPGTFQVTSCTDNGTTYACTEPLSTTGAVISGTPSTNAKAAIPPGAYGVAGDETSTAGVPATGVDYMRYDSVSHCIEASVNGSTEACLSTGGVSLIAAGTSALGTSAISSGACASVVTTAATGVATTDVVPWGFNADPTGITGYVPATSGMLTIIAYPTANNVNFKVCNNTTSPITPGAVTLNWRVVR